MSIAALLLAAATPPVAASDIVVTGVPLATLEREARRCAEGGCTPREDIVASIRYAEGLFKTGRYVAARKLLQGTIGRTKPAEAAEPLAVSELYLATATVAKHDGEERVVKAASYDRARVLKAHLPPTSRERLLAELGVADLLYRGGDRFGAARRYAQVAEATRAAGLPDLTALVTLREATLAFQQRRDAEADRLLAAIVADRDPKLANYRMAALALQARLARSRGDKQAIDTLLAALAREGRGPAPTLLWEPPLPLVPDATIRNPFEAALLRSNTAVGGIFSVGWVDIGYTIRPDGTVETPEVVRGNRGEGWARDLLAQVAGRRYSPFGSEADAGQYRVERITLTAEYETPSGSLVRVRARNPHFERMDLTAGTAPRTAAR